jgi:hypothetical protein
MSIASRNISIIKSLLVKNRFVLMLSPRRGGYVQGTVQDRGEKWALDNVRLSPGRPTADMPERQLRPSRPEEFHPEPLTDPDLTLSRDPARATARRLPPSVENWSSSCCQLARSQRRWPAPFAPRALPRFNTTTGSAPLQRISTFGLAVACAFFPWHRRPGSHVPYKSQIEVHAASMPDAAWAVSGHPLS